MTFIYELDLYPLKMYLQTKNELPRSRLSKVRALQTDRQTDRQTDETKRISTASFPGRNDDFDCWSFFIIRYRIGFV